MNLKNRMNNKKQTIKKKLNGEPEAHILAVEVSYFSTVVPVLFFS